MKLAANLTPFSVLTANSDGLARSRRGALIYAYLSNFITNMVTMTYFVGLMLEMGADENYISAVTITITVCSFLQFLSPLLLERLKRRKTFLMAMRAAYHLCYVVILGVIPILPLGKTVMLGAFIATVIVANVINSLSVSGVSIWHMQNFSAEKYSDFFTLSNVGSQIINALTGLGASRIVDTFQENSLSICGISPLMTAFLLLRLVALTAAIGELVSLAVIKEHPYEQKTTTERRTFGFKMLFLPLTNRPFIKTIMIYIIYFFTSGLIGKYFEVYLLEIAKMSYTYKSLSGVISLPIVLLLSPVWSYLLRRFSWTRVMPIALTGTAIGYFFNTLITTETHFFHICCSIFYSSFHVAVAIIFAFLPYVHMPKTDRTAYISFFTISGAVAGLLGNFAGTLFMMLSKGLEYELFGLRITNYQTLNLIQTVLFLLLAVYTVFVARDTSDQASE